MQKKTYLNRLIIYSTSKDEKKEIGICRKGWELELAHYGSQTEWNGAICWPGINQAGTNHGGRDKRQGHEQTTATGITILPESTYYTTREYLVYYQRVAPPSAPDARSTQPGQDHLILRGQTMTDDIF